MDEFKKALGKATWPNSVVRLFEKRGDGFRLYQKSFQPGETNQILCKSPQYEKQ